MTNHIAHFEIFASDVERARKFYEKVLAWRFEEARRARRVSTAFKQCFGVSPSNYG